MKRLLGLLNRSKVLFWIWIRLKINPTKFRIATREMSKTSRRGVHLYFEGDPRFLWSRIDPQEFCPIMITGKLTYICNHDQGNEDGCGRNDYNILEIKLSHFQSWRTRWRVDQNSRLFGKRVDIWFRWKTTVKGFMNVGHLNKIYVLGLKNLELSQGGSYLWVNTQILGQF